MKKEIHPKNYIVNVKCACGAEYETESTVSYFSKIEICKGCHPFFTGKHKIIGGAGMVDKFKKRMESSRIK